MIEEYVKKVLVESRSSWGVDNKDTWIRDGDRFINFRDFDFEIHVFWHF